MLFRNCAGGIVFSDEKVLILKNEKNEWVLPKGKIRKGFLSVETAVQRVKEEAGIIADVISTAGETCYEFFSVSRQKPVCNEITWYIMEVVSGETDISVEERFSTSGFYEIGKAVDMLSHNQEKSLVSLSYKKYKKLKDIKVVLA